MRFEKSSGHDFEMIVAIVAIAIMWLGMHL